MNEKNIILTARVVSMVLTPFYLPVVGILAIFTFSYLSMVPWQAKLSYVFLVYAFTVLIPTLLIHLYRQYHGWTLIQLGQRERRMVPYVIFYPLLLHVLLYHEYPAPASHADVNTYGSIDHSDSMCYHQRMVEDINTYGSYRWCDRFFDSFFTAFQLQSDVVALSYAHRFRLWR